MLKVYGIKLFFHEEVSNLRQYLRKAETAYRKFENFYETILEINYDKHYFRSGFECLKP